MTFSPSPTTHRSSTTPPALLNQKCHIWAHRERNLGKLFFGGASV